MVTDQRTIEVIQSMGPLQSAITFPFILLKGWPLTVIDLNDQFFTISLQEKDRENLPSQCIIITEDSPTWNVK